MEVVGSDCLEAKIMKSGHLWIVLNIISKKQIATKDYATLTGNVLKKINYCILFIISLNENKLINKLMKAQKENQINKLGKKPSWIPK